MKENMAEVNEKQQNGERAGNTYDLDSVALQW